MTPQLQISYFIFQRSHHRGLHRAANVGLVGVCRLRRILVIAPGTIGEQLLPPLHHYRNDFPSDASWAGGTRNSQTAQDPDCMRWSCGRSCIHLARLCILCIGQKKMFRMVQRFISCSCIFSQFVQLLKLFTNTWENLGLFLKYNFDLKRRTIIIVFHHFVSERIKQKTLAKSYFIYTIVDKNKKMFYFICKAI